MQGGMVPEKMFLSYEDLLSMMEEDFRDVRKWLRNHNMDYQGYNKAIDTLVGSRSVYSFRFGSKEWNEVYRDQNKIIWDAVESRVQTYHKWLNRLTRIISLPNFRFCIEFEDMASDTIGAPVLCYHKKYGHNIILIPDFEIYDYNYYCREIYSDNLCFEEKYDKAVFVGSTTGTNQQEDRGCCNTMDNIDHDPCVRVSAAKYFDGNASVIFKLPSIVQCDSAETEGYLRSFGFTQCPRMDWVEQFKYKFIISVDGNGPTCTRVAVALLSNSVLLKYESRWITYYHRALRPYYNYVPIAWHDDIHDVLNKINNNYAYYAAISRRASEDFSLILRKSNVDRYFAAVLNEFYALFWGEDDNYYENRLRLDQVTHLDIDAHFTNIGDVWFYPSMEVKDQVAENCIEGLTITPASSLFKWSDISYQVMFEDGSTSDIVLGGHFIGTKGEGNKITGFKMDARSKYGFSLFYSGVFKNGIMRKVCNGEWLRCENVPIKRIAFHLNTACA
jgi:hypothetical protein